MRTMRRGDHGGPPMDHARRTFAALERFRIRAAVVRQLDAIHRSALDLRIDPAIIRMLIRASGN